MHMIRPWQSLDPNLIGNSWGIFLSLFYKPSGISTNKELIIGRPMLIPIIDLRRMAIGRRHGDAVGFEIFTFNRLWCMRDVSHVLLREEEEENMHQKKMSNENKTLQVVFFYGQYKWLISWMVEIISSRPDVSPTELCVSVFRHDGRWAHQRSDFTTAKSCLTELWFR